MEALVAVSVDASATQGGEDSTVRSLVRTVTIIIIHIHIGLFDICLYVQCNHLLPHNGWHYVQV